MSDYEMVCLMLFLVFTSLLICCGMLAGIRDCLANIDYDLCTRNMVFFCQGKGESATENDA